MDPNELLDLMLRAALDIVEHDNRRSGHESPEAAANTLAESVLSLDEWMRKDGFLPEAWQQARRK